MPRRVVTYLPSLQTANQVATAFAFLLGLSIFPFLYNLVYSWGWGRIADANPWRSRSLEWQLPTPVPPENFEEVPLIVAGPYDYGVKNAPAMAILKPSAQPAYVAGASPNAVAAPQAPE